MNIVNAIRTDTGGQAERLSRAINTLPGGNHSSRAFTSQMNYIKYPVDILYNKRWKVEGFPEEVLKLWREADVFHLHHHLTWEKQWPLRLRGKHTGAILHMHGRPPAADTPEVFAKRDAPHQIIRVVTSLTLLPLVFGKTHRWFPSPMDFPLLRHLREENKKDDGLFRVVHAPTVNKNTEEFLEVMELIEQKYEHVQTILIRKQTHARCLELKAVGDLYFNALHHGVGNNIFECMVMGIPTITGQPVDGSINHPFVPGSAGTTRVKELHPDGKLPYMHVERNKDSLFDVIEEAIINDSLRQEIIALGTTWVEKYHTFKYTAELAIKTYQEAIDMRN